MKALYVKMTIAWVTSAKKEENRLRRRNQLTGFSAENRRTKFM